MRGCIHRGVRRGLRRATLAGLGLLIACGGDAPVILVEHPIADSVDFALGARRIERTSASSGDMVHLASRLADHEVLVSIGVAGEGEVEAPGPEVFGRIVDVAVVGADRVAVLDQMASRVEIFDLDGQSRGGFGGPGEGPGELDLPITLLVPDSTEIQVLDAVGRVHRFTEDADGEWVFEERTDIVGFPQDACVELGGARTVVHIPAVAPSDASLAARGVLRVHDRDGSDLRSFGTPYRHEQFLVANRMRRGQVTCTEGDHVVLALEGANRAAAWGLDDGTELWNGILEGIEILKLREMRLPDGRPGVGQDPRGASRFHTLMAIEPADGDRVLLQYARFAWSDDLGAANSEGVETWILDAATGAGGVVSEAVPQIGAIRGSVVVFVHEDPYPRIEVARW